MIQISPPLVAGQAEFDEIVGILGDVLAEAGSRWCGGAERLRKGVVNRHCAGAVARVGSSGTDQGGSDGERKSGAVVVARDVTRRYGEGDTAVDALRGVSLDVRAGRARRPSWGRPARASRR